MMVENIPSNPPVQPVVTNQKAVWSLILGILSLICCGFISGVPGWILAVMAKKEIRETKQQGEGMATAGLILSIVGVVLSILGIIGYILFMVLFVSQFDSIFYDYFG